MITAKVIVMIDDDLPSVEMLVKYLRKIGHRVCYFYEGESALSFIREERPHLVISDMLLPQVHGLDICRRIKTDTRLAKTPVVLMTGVYRDPRQRKEVDAVGADAFFTKPFDLARTINDLHQLMGEREVTIDQEEAKEEVETLAQNYEAALPGKIREIDLLLDRLEEQKGSRDALAYLHLQVHSLAGSSATFGFTQISKWAATMSNYLRELMARVELPSIQEFEQIRIYVEELRFNLPGASQARPLATVATTGPRDDSLLRTIFLVDSNDLQANELSLQLELLGFLVRRFPDEDHLLAYQGNPPDALVMEFEMPEGQLIRIKEDPRFCNLPLLFASTEGSMYARLTAVRVGGDAFLKKPIDPGALVSRIDQLSGRHQQPARVLIVCDDRKESDRLAGALRMADMVVEVILDPVAALEPLSSFSPDLVLVDMDLTSCQGLDLVRLIRQDSSFLGVAVMLMVQDPKPLLINEFLGEGVDDVLAKPVKPGPLIARLSHRANRFRALRAFMLRDSLTGLLNSGTLMYNLKVELERARRGSLPLSVAMFNIDHLTRLNKMYGHVTGNIALRNLAAMLMRRLRNSDFIGRFEGPSILVLFPETDQQRAFGVIEGIASDFARYHMYAGTHEFYATFSCGLSSFPRAKDTNALVEGARRALKKARDLGGNRVWPRDG